VNIVNPGSLPDPTGLAGALKVLGTPGIFRDQSGIQETGTMLGKLSDNATTLASQALQGQNRKSLMDDIKASNLSDGQKTDLIGKLLLGQVDQQTKSATPPSGGGGTTGGTTTGGTTGVDLGSGSTLPPSPVPVPLPKGSSNPPQPPAKPAPAKPPRTTPVTEAGLHFYISFKNPQSTTVEGTAGVYVDGKDSSQEQGPYLPIERGSLVKFNTTRIGVDGKITILAQYRLTSDEAFFAEVAGKAGTGLPVNPAMHLLKGDCKYTKPADGNEIWLTATPIVTSVKVTATSA
jgi:hypothetical protein